VTKFLFLILLLFLIFNSLIGIDLHHHGYIYKAVYDNFLDLNIYENVIFIYQPLYFVFLSILVVVANNYLLIQILFVLIQIFSIIFVLGKNLKLNYRLLLIILLLVSDPSLKKLSTNLNSIDNNLTFLPWPNLLLFPIFWILYLGIKKSKNLNIIIGLSLLISIRLQIGIIALILISLSFSMTNYKQAVKILTSSLILSIFFNFSILLVIAKNLNSLKAMIYNFIFYSSNNWTLENYINSLISNFKFEFIFLILTFIIILIIRYKNTYAGILILILIVSLNNKLLGITSANFVNTLPHIGIIFLHIFSYLALFQNIKMFISSKKIKYLNFCTIIISSMLQTYPVNDLRHQYWAYLFPCLLFVKNFEFKNTRFKTFYSILMSLIIILNVTYIINKSINTKYFYFETKTIFKNYFKLLNSTYDDKIEVVYGLERKGIFLVWGHRIGYFLLSNENATPNGYLARNDLLLAKLNVANFIINRRPTVIIDQIHPDFTYVDSYMSVYDYCRVYDFKSMVKTNLSLINYRVAVYNWCHKPFFETNQNGKERPPWSP